MTMKLLTKYHSTSIISGLYPDIIIKLTNE